MINQTVVYQNDQGCLTIVYPAPGSSISFEEICQKDVPAGKAFLVVPEELIPVDHTFFEAWEADFSNPDGYGIGPDAWFAQQEASE
jgi:hypothetical protein